MTRTLLSLLLAAGLVGCASRKANTPDTHVDSRPPAPTTTPREANETRPSSSEPADALAALNAAPIYFTLDSATLAPEAREELERVALALRQRSLAKVTVAGHTCELGTTEYNIALGQRRADIVRSYLVRLGVERERISVVSYGEERPADVNVPEKNRRAELAFRVAEQARAGEL
jgi:peptidoglycan-associated lipoprotein